MDQPSEGSVFGDALKSTEPKKEDAPKEEKKADAPVEEEEYELELPKDSKLTEEDLNEIAEEASRLGLSKADAEKLLKLKETSLSKGYEKAMAEAKAKNEEARKQILADPMFSEANKAQTFDSMARAVRAFGDEEVVKLLHTPEYGNNIHIARMLKKIGDLIKPEPIPKAGGVDGGNGNGGKQTKSEEEVAKNWYPDFYKQS